LRPPTCTQANTASRHNRRTLGYTTVTSLLLTSRIDTGTFCHKRQSKTKSKHRSSAYPCMQAAPPAATVGCRRFQKAQLPTCKAVNRQGRLTYSWLPPILHGLGTLLPNITPLLHIAKSPCGWPIHNTHTSTKRHENGLHQQAHNHTPHARSRQGEGHTNACSLECSSQQPSELRAQDKPCK
jgi:hypothetical protein